MKSYSDSANDTPTGAISSNGKGNSLDHQLLQYNTESVKNNKLDYKIMPQ